LTFSAGGGASVGASVTTVVGFSAGGCVGCASVGGISVGGTCVGVAFGAQDANNRNAMIKMALNRVWLVLRFIFHSPLQTKNQLSFSFQLSI
jgi:hypothetical protein